MERWAPGWNITRKLTSTVAAAGKQQRMAQSPSCSLHSAKLLIVDPTLLRSCLAVGQCPRTFPC